MIIMQKQAELLQYVADAPLSRRAKSAMCQGIKRHRIYTVSQLTALIQSGSVKCWPQIGQRIYDELKVWINGS